MQQLITTVNVITRQKEAKWNMKDYFWRCSYGKCDSSDSATVLPDLRACLPVSYGPEQFVEWIQVKWHLSKRLQVK